MWDGAPGAHLIADPFCGPWFSFGHLCAQYGAFEAPNSVSDSVARFGNEKRWCMVVSSTDGVTTLARALRDPLATFERS